MFPKHTEPKNHTNETTFESCMDCIRNLAKQQTKKEKLITQLQRSLEDEKKKTRLLQYEAKTEAHEFCNYFACLEPQNYIYNNLLICFVTINCIRRHSIEHRYKTVLKQGIKILSIIIAGKEQKTDRLTLHELEMIFADIHDRSNKLETLKKINTSWIYDLTNNKNTKIVDDLSLNTNKNSHEVESNDKKNLMENNTKVCLPIYSNYNYDKQE